MSKGSNQRPKAVDDETFESNWNQAFGVGLVGLVQRPDGPITPESAQHSADLDQMWKETNKV